MEKQAKAIMLEYPNYNSLCLKVIGESLFARGQYEEAKSHYVTVTEKNPKLAWAHHGIALCEMKLGNIQAAIENSIKTTQLSHHFLSAYDLLAEAQEQLKEYEAAQATMIEVIGISPYSIDRAENLGRLSTQIQDWENAEQGYSRAVRLSRDTNEEKVERYYSHLQSITSLIESGDQSPKLAERFQRSLTRLRTIGKDNPTVITNSFRAEINQKLTRDYREEAIKSWKEWNDLIAKGYAASIPEAQQKVIKMRLGLL
jgi:tetratricopeptide (TPR) repeat protein